MNAKRGLAQELIGNMGHGKVAEEGLRERERGDYIEKVKVAEMGEKGAKIKELEKKAE